MADQLTLQTPTAKTTTAELLAALKAHYVKPSDLSKRYASETESDLLVEEVCAPGSNRRCDLLRIGMWASRGHRIIVHEIKISRSDFLKELDDPAKAEAWWPYCHEFWITAPDGLIDPGELPDGWGLMVPPANARIRKFRVRKAAAVKEPTVTPLLLVEVARRVDNARIGEIAQLNETHRNALYRAVDAEKRRQVERTIPPDVKARLELLDRLEDALDIRLASHTWSGDEAIRKVTPESAAAGLADYLVGHVSLQRIAEDMFRQAANLARFSAKAAETLTKAREELASMAPIAAARDEERRGGLL